MKTVLSSRFRQTPRQVVPNAFSPQEVTPSSWQIKQFWLISDLEVDDMNQFGA